MEKEHLLDDINSGLSTYAIAKKRNIGQTTVRYWLKKFSIKANANRPTKYEKIDWNFVQSQYDAHGTWDMLNTLGYSNNCLAWGLKNKKLFTRSASDALKLAWGLGRQNVEKYRTEEYRKKQSKFGGIKANAGRCKLIKHISPIAGEVYLNGTWEYKYALWLDENNIDWRRNKKGFPYMFDGKRRKYYPDFHLLSENKYVEVKGYETEKDKAKWSQFPEKLLVLKKIELNNAPYNLNLR